MMEEDGMLKQTFSLEDKYTAEEGRIFLSGIQALVRLPIVQMRRDHAAGLNTAAFVSGYRGSPLGGYDQQLAKAGKHLSAHGVEFRPGVNEDLAATAIWGTSGARSSFISRPAPARMASSATGTARGRASIAPATSSSMPMRPARPGTAACSVLPATTIPASRLPSRTSPTTPSCRRSSPSYIRPPSRNSSNTACSASPCRAIPAAGWR